MSQRPRRRLPSAVLEKARQLAEAQGEPSPAPPRNTVAPARNALAPARNAAAAPRTEVKAKIASALRKLHPMD